MSLNPKKIWYPHLPPVGHFRPLFVKKTPKKQHFRGLGGVSTVYMKVWTILDDYQGYHCTKRLRGLRLDSIGTPVYIWSTLNNFRPPTPTIRNHQYSMKMHQISNITIFFYFTYYMFFLCEFFLEKKNIFCFIFCKETVMWKNGLKEKLRKKQSKNKNVTELSKYHMLHFFF